MPDVFTLFGTLKADTAQFESSLRRAEQRLEQTEDAIAKTENKAKKLGDGTATTARQFEKLRESTGDATRKLTDAVQAFSKGEISAKQFARTINSAENAMGRASSKAKDMNARLKDVAARSDSKGGGLVGTIVASNLLANAMQRAGAAAFDFTKDGVGMAMTLDKLTRKLSTLDKAWQNPLALTELRNIVKDLSKEMPQTAESFAEAAFTLKSAYADADPTQLAEGLRSMGIAATGSGTDVATHTAQIAALAKEYGIAIKELPKLNALLSTSYGMALSSDAKVAGGFNKLIVSSKAAKIPLEELIATMSILQSKSNSPEQNTTNLQNLIAKLGDPNVIKNLKEVFNIDRFEGGKLKGLVQIVNELDKALSGLSDAEKLKRISKVFTDLQAREGVMPLIEDVQTLNKVLREGADLDAYAQKTGTMLDSLESRWSRFYNTVLAGQTGLGERLAEDALGAFDSETLGGGIAIAANNLSAALGKIYYPYQTFGKAIEEEQARRNRAILEQQRDANKQLAETTNDPNIRIQATAAQERLSQAIQRNDMALIARRYQDWKQVGESAIRGLAATDAGVKAQAAKTTQAVLDQINQTLAGTGIDEGTRKMLEAFRDKLSKGLADAGAKAAEAAAPAVADAAARTGESTVRGFVEGVNSGAPAMIKAALAAISAPVTAAMGAVKEKEKPLGMYLVDHIRRSAESAYGPANKGGQEIGRNVVDGLIAGILAGAPNARAAALKLALAAVQGGQAGVKAHSPSEEFHQIGVWVGEGFANGMNAMKPVVDKAARELVNKDQFKGIAKDIADSFRDATAKLDVSMPGAGAKMGVPGFIAGLKGKDGEAALALAGELIKKLAEMNAETNLQQVLLTLAEGKYKKLTAAQIEFIKALAAGLDAEEKTKDAVQKLVDLQEDFNDQFQKSPSAIEQVNEALKDTAYLERYAASVKMTTDEVAKFLRQQAWLKDALDLAASRPKDDIAPPPITPSGTRDTTAPGGHGNGVDVTLMPPTKAWEDFWKTFRGRIAQMRKELPSLKQALGETFIDTFSKAADVLANAVANWDGTLKGFFNSVKEGFRQMISELIAQLIRLMIMKAALAILGNAASGAAGAQGSVGSATDGAGGSIPGGGHAAGGLIRGPGSGTSDSILSWLSNGEFVIPAKAVRKFGVGFFEQIRSMQMPALAGGGMMPATAMGSSASSYAYHNNVTVNLSGGGSDGRTGSQIARETMIALRRMEERNR